ncbi:MAG: riboflavin kinase [Methanomicrobiales archaeon HGW-Methanomicrobiales-4]|nr:MAG: riboflavin kinase [Methanomicrobiales archaeon HGW-Methanomicrobiales-4]
MIGPEDLECLKRIALRGGLGGPVFLNSQSLGDELGISPQTASRRLKSLEKTGLIRRTLIADGQQVTVNEEGESALRNEYCEYYRLFGGKEKNFQLQGTVESGLGEGAYYMSLRQYMQQFEKIIGFAPYPGTLNLRLSPTAVQRRKRLTVADWYQVDGFESEGRTFGQVRCLPCMIREVPCGIVVPGRSHYPDALVEVIAPVGLRGELNLKDGDEVVIEVSL